MTKWELGQDLIAISDDMAEKIYDMGKAGHKELAIRLDIIRAQIGDLFNEHNDHGFGIFDSDRLVNLITKNQISSPPKPETKE